MKQKISNEFEIWRECSEQVMTTEDCCHPWAPSLFPLRHGSGTAWRSPLRHGSERLSGRSTLPLRLQLQLAFCPSSCCVNVVSQCRVRLHGQLELASGGQEVALGRGAELAQDGAVLHIGNRDPTRLPGNEYFRAAQCRRNALRKNVLHFSQCVVAGLRR